MEHLVMRLYESGVRVQKHVRQAGQSRGTLWVSTELVQRRQMLVAWLQEATGQRKIPRLYEPVLVGLSSGSWVLAGHERIEAGPTRSECLVGQTWLVEPAVMTDVMAIEQKWLAAVREANALRQRLEEALATAPPAAQNAGQSTSRAPAP